MATQSIIVGTCGGEVIEITATKPENNSNTTTNTGTTHPSHPDHRRRC